MNNQKQKNMTELDERIIKNTLTDLSAMLYDLMIRVEEMEENPDLERIEFMRNSKNVQEGLLDRLFTPQP